MLVECKRRGASLLFPDAAVLRYVADKESKKPQIE